jgi:hypothetical protein
MGFLSESGIDGLSLAYEASKPLRSHRQHLFKLGLIRAFSIPVIRAGRLRPLQMAAKNRLHVLQLRDVPKTFS